jgi:spermidine/putrescine transport system substrate-binding protein
MRHPRERGTLSRRDFLQRGAGATLGLSSLGAILAACGGGETAAPPAAPAEPAAPPAEPGEPPAPPAEPSATTGGAATTEESGLQLARPDSPVTLQIFDDNPPIESGLSPEAGPLKVYNWIDYIWKRKLRDFEKEFGVTVELSTFYTMDEAVQKLSTGAVDYDVFFPTPDRIGRLVLAKLMQPLNHDYIPNLAANVWPALQNPFYDQGSQYTVPYTIYTTGIGYRVDKVTEDVASLPNPYDIYFNGAYKGNVFLLDDAREAIGMMLLKDGVVDVNTSDPAAIDAAKAELLELIDAVNVKTSIEDYSKLPEGSAWIHQAWSGSMIAAQWYLPKGTGPEVLAYWFPPEGNGMIGSDMMGVLRSAKNPVLAHLFLNFMLDEQNAYDNFAQFNGYQPPLTSLDPSRLVSDGVVPENLANAVAEESDFVNGYQLLELPTDAAIAWQNAWAEFKAGV